MAGKAWMWHAWFHASAGMCVTSALCWDITQRQVVVRYRRFGTTYRSHLHGSRITTIRCVTYQKKADLMNVSFHVSLFVEVFMLLHVRMCPSEHAFEAWWDGIDCTPWFVWWDSLISISYPDCKSQTNNFGKKKKLKTTDYVYFTYLLFTYQNLPLSVRVVRAMYRLQRKTQKQTTRR